MMGTMISKMIMWLGLNKPSRKPNNGLMGNPLTFKGLAFKLKIQRSWSAAWFFINSSDLPKYSNHSTAGTSEKERGNPASGRSGPATLQSAGACVRNRRGNLRQNDPLDEALGWERFEEAGVTAPCGVSNLWIQAVYSLAPVGDKEETKLFGR